jgi:hypothetical protein
MDGPVEVVEVTAQCRPCRRSFFPPPHQNLWVNVGSGRQPRL